MRVPRLLVLTDRHQSEALGRTLPETVALALRAGAPAIVLREKDLPRAARRALAVELRDLVGPHGARLLVASDTELARELEAAGVHLAGGDPPADEASQLVGRSCHARSEVLAAADQGSHYVTVSPVAVTTSKPGYGPALGPRGLSSLVDAVPELPVLALGGVTPVNVPVWMAAGAHGVAVMGAVMGAADPGANVRSFLESLPTETP
jgi:thiamine-phosphate diphosphorylase